MKTAAQKVALAIAVGAIAVPVSAASPEGLPDVFRKLLECRSVPEAAARLACYDQSVTAVDLAQRRKDLVVVDRQQMRETRRSLFGFPIPKLGIFGGGKDDERDKANAIVEIESTVVSARGAPGGNIRIVLADGAGVWEATSGVDVQPRPGDKVRIRQGSLGSYLAVIGYNRGVRMRRVE